jgi:hypothetical protein
MAEVAGKHVVYEALFEGEGSNVGGGTGMLFPRANNDFVNAALIPAAHAAPLAEAFRNARRELARIPPSNLCTQIQATISIASDSLQFVQINFGIVDFL